MSASFADLRARRERAKESWAAFASPRSPVILVGDGTCGRAAGSGEVIEALQSELAELGVGAEIVRVGCLGLCHAEPLVEVRSPGGPWVLYGGVTPDAAREIARRHVKAGKPYVGSALAVMEGEAPDGVPRFEDLPFVKGQVRIVTRNCGRIDPSSFEHCLANGGYEGLEKALSMSPGEVIAEVERSGLRGRGGAGFPTGRKWRFARESTRESTDKGRDSQKYLVCNADEGDPGAFMDRTVLESDPHAVLEGMAVAAYAIGASEAYVYCRAEYPLAIERLRNAISQMEEAGLLGDDVLGSGFALRVRIKEGAGAFVCGEETALMASIEGRRGTPRVRPPFPAQSGLFGRPTNINNVETFANVPAILREGADWYSQYGTESSRGTKTFALAGKVARTGLVEVPMGMKLRDIIFGIGGGIPRGRRFKAVQTGGPSGGCLPGSCLELPVDYETLARAGSIMGSGGMIVMDEDTCVPDIARYFLGFTKEESCGKCSPCRLGTWQMKALLDDVCAGRATGDDLELLEEMANAVKVSALCGLGQTAPNPVLTTLKYFRDEYESHVRWRKCTAATCEELVRAPCTHTCPAEVDVPRYIRLVAAGRFDDALAVIRERIPFPSVCGRVCFQPCAAKCRRGPLDGALSVRALKRFVSEKGTPRVPERAPATGKRVAVVGSGPAGLTCAYYLALAGHEVTVFELAQELGGMLRGGIPSYRLPREEIDGEIDLIIDRAGVKVEKGKLVDSPADLLAEGPHGRFDAVFAAPGAQRGAALRVPGDDTDGVVQAIDFLREANRGGKPNLGKRVAVIGGGNTAMDAARTAVRLGSEVTVLYRRSREQMPAGEEEVSAAEAEGVTFEFLAAPVRIERKGDAVGVTLVRTELGPFDDSGRPRPVPVEGSEFAREFDTVIAAVGQEVDREGCAGVGIDRRGRIVADPETLASSCRGVFVGGDAVTGPASVIEAIAQGRRAASAIDRYLGGTGEIDRPSAVRDAELPPVEEGERAPVLPGERPAAERASDFAEIEICYTPDEAMREALRCLRCDLEEAAE